MSRYPLPPLAMDYAIRGTFAPFAGLSDETFDRAIGAALYAPWPVANNYDCPEAPVVGQRVRIRRTVDRPDFVALRGLSGTVIISEADEMLGLIAVELDRPLDNGYGDTTVYWETDHASDAPDAYAVKLFWRDCAAIVHPQHFSPENLAEVCR
jgi:hypothetical protein